MPNAITLFIQQSISISNPNTPHPLINHFTLPACNGDITWYYLRSAFITSQCKFPLHAIMSPAQHSWSAPCDVCRQCNVRVNVLNIIGLDWHRPPALTLSNSIWIFCINDNWMGPACIGSESVHRIHHSLIQPQPDVWQSYANLDQPNFYFYSSQTSMEKSWNSSHRVLELLWTFTDFESISCLVSYIGIPCPNIGINNK